MDNINEAVIVKFIRNDLPIEQDDIQAGHACFHLGMVTCAALGNVPGVPFLSSKEKLRTASLEKLERYCIANEILHYLMHDEDVDKEHGTSLAVLAVTSEQKQFFRKYPLRKYAPAVEQSTSLPASGGANADVAQVVEHSVFNGEVAGAAPAVSSKHLGCA